MSETRAQIIEYLDFVSDELMQMNHYDAQAEIERAAARLIELSLERAAVIKVEFRS
jgi:hypothetical protein